MWRGPSIVPDVYELKKYRKYFITRIVDKKAGEFMIVTIASAVHVQLASTLEDHDQSTAIS